MNLLARYDELLSLTYEAGQGRCPIGAMLARAATELDAAAAGFLVYDDAGRQVTHSIVAPPRAGPPELVARLRAMNDDVAVSALSRIRLREPRRFTDIVPRARLRNATWFRLQERLAGFGFGIAVDLDLAGVRVRIFAMRAVHAPDFDSGPLELLGRFGRHVERAFAGTAHRLGPHRQGADAAVLVFRYDALAAAMGEERREERQLVVRFGLTPAEARVALAAAEGQSRVVTAEQLDISLNSLKTHLRRIHSKLGVRRAVELARAVTAVGEGASPASRSQQSTI